MIRNTSKKKNRQFQSPHYEVMIHKKAFMLFRSSSSRAICSNHKTRVHVVFSHTIQSDTGFIRNHKKKTFTLRHIGSTPQPATHGSLSIT